MDTATARQGKAHSTNAAAESLAAQLRGYREGFVKQAPAEALAIFQQAAEALDQSGLEKLFVRTGDKAPDFTLPNATGTTVQLSQVLARGPVVLSFYRGAWCPYCALELRALQRALPEIRRRGASLVAVSPQTPDNSLTTAERDALEFEVLSDVGNKVARAYGLVFTLAEELRPIYLGFEIDIPAHNGDSSFEIPVPATYVIGSEGKVRLGYANLDYTQRLEPAEILNALS